jgi:hypothetical protein
MRSQLNQKTDMNMNLILSDHAYVRSCQRGIEPIVISEILKYGQQIYKQGYVFHYLSKADLKLFYHADDRKKLENVIVLTGPEGSVITTYRNPDALGEIKRKSKRLSKRPKSFVHNKQLVQEYRSRRFAA